MSDKETCTAYGGLVITSAALETLLAGGGKTWDVPAAGIMARPMHIDDKPISPHSATDDAPDPA
jgi:hypothetical protein